MREYVPIIKQTHRHFRLCVCTAVPGEDVWGDPRPAQIDDLIDAIKALTPEMQAHLMTHLGLTPESVGERLKAAEHVLDAVADAQLAINRFRAYRKRFPERESEEG